MPWCVHPFPLSRCPDHSLSCQVFPCATAFVMCCLLPQLFNCLAVYDVLHESTQKYVQWGKVTVTWMAKYLDPNIWSTIYEMSDSRKHTLQCSNGECPCWNFHPLGILSTAIFSVMSMCTYLAVYLVEEVGISDKILHNSPSHAHFRCIPFMLWHSMRVLKSKCHIYILLQGVRSCIPVL